MTGFRIDPFPNGLAMLDPSNVRDDWLQGPGMAAMWECAAETGQAICVLINPSDLPDVDAMCKAIVCLAPTTTLGHKGAVVWQASVSLTRLWSSITSRGLASAGPSRRRSWRSCAGSRGIRR